MTEAALAVIEFGFTVLGANRIEASHALWNIASQKVLTKIGMKFVRHIAQGFQKHGKWVEENLLAIEKKIGKLKRYRRFCLQSVEAVGESKLFGWEVSF